MFTPNKRKIKTKDILCSSFEPSDFLQLQPSDQRTIRKQYKYADKENVAKEVLIQIGELELIDNEPISSRTVPLPIDSWACGSSRIKNEIKRERNNFIYTRNVRSVTAGAIKQKNYEENNVLKLKEALKKLQSPQKTKDYHRKSRQKNSKCQILQSLLNKRRVQTKVSDLIKLKQCENLKSNASSNHFHTRKISSNMENRQKKQSGVVNYPQPLDTRKFNQLFNFNYKEARKNRTLKGLLT